jgi:hypothetical protein
MEHHFNMFRATNGAHMETYYMTPQKLLGFVLLNCEITYSV